MIPLTIAGAASTAVLAAALVQWALLEPLERRAVAARLLTPDASPTTGVAASDPAAFLDRVAREIRLGSSAAAAFVAVAASSPAESWWTTEVANSCRRGVGLSDAIVEQTRVSWPRDVRDAARTLAIAARGGAGTADALSRGASLIRETAALESERGTASAHARASVAMLTSIPLASFGFVVALSPSARATMLASPLGLAACGLGVLGNLVGRRWMRSLIGGTTR